MRTIDIHAHWYPEEWIRLFEKDGPKEGASLERKDGKYHLKAKHITNAFDERFVGVSSRIEAMDARRIDVQDRRVRSMLQPRATLPVRDDADGGA